MTTDMAPPPHRHRVAVHSGQNGRGGGGGAVLGGGPELRKQRNRPHSRFSPSDRPQDRKSAPALLKGPGALAGRPRRGCRVICPAIRQRSVRGLSGGPVHPSWGQIRDGSPADVWTDPRTDPGRAAVRGGCPSWWSSAARDTGGSARTGRIITSCSFEGKRAADHLYAPLSADLRPGRPRGARSGRSAAREPLGRLPGHWIRSCPCR